MMLNFHQKAMLIGAVTVVLCVGVFLWIVVLDKGTLAVTANPPYEISVEGSRLKVPTTRLCTADPCELSLPSGDFALTVSKSGYFAETAAVNIDRGETTALTFELAYVPIVGEVHAPANDALLLALAATPTPSTDFVFALDLTYKKQRLDYIDPATQTVTTWAYFDRPLVDPLVFPNEDRTRALVVDRVETGVDQLYLLDGVAFSRTSAGELEAVVSAEWSPDDREILIETAGSTPLFHVVFHLDLSTLTLTDWPLVSTLDKVTWDGQGHRLFATPYDLSKETAPDAVTSLDMLQLVLNGAPIPDERRVFSIGEYDPLNGTYRSLTDVPASLEIDYDAVQLVVDPTTRDLYFTDGMRFFKVVRG